MKNALPHNGQHLYQVGDFQLNTADGALMFNGVPVAITPKMFDVLWLLVQNQGRIVGKDELLKAVWSDSFVEEANITVTIGQLRKALGDDAHTPSYIQTVARRGYRFVAPVEEIHERTEPESDSKPPVNGNGVSVGQRSAVQNGGNGKPASAYNGSSTQAHGSAAVEKKQLPRALPIVIIVATLIAAAGAFYIWQNGTRSMASRLTSLRAERLSDTGENSGANISPDGKLLAYSTLEGGRSVIWIRQLTTGTTLQITPPADHLLNGLGFSNDGEYLYYYHSRDGRFNDVSRISILGGTPTRILSNVHGGFTFSPDGAKVAFTRFTDHQSSIFMANSDGTDERSIIDAPKGLTIMSVDWAPDGTSLAYIVQKFMSRGRECSLVEYDLATADQRPLTDFKWNQLESVMWLSDKSGILTSGRDAADNTDQIWLTTIPTGEVRQVTFNSSSLTLRGASADLSKIIARETILKSQLAVGEATDPSAIQPFSTAQFDFAFLRDGSIVFPAADTSSTDIWISNPDGSGRRQLTANAAVERSPAVSPDGRFIVYVADTDGKRSIWRMDTDGGNPTRLTTGDGEHYPTFTLDSRFVVYNSLADGSVLKVPVEGGEPSVIFGERAVRVTISPDGQAFAYIGTKDNARTLFVRDLTNAALLKSIVIPGRQVPASKVVWSPDGDAILFPATDQGKTSNIFRQRLDGTPPEKLTDFTSDLIFDFDYSADGSRMGLIRGSWKHDMILLTGLD